MTQTWKIAAGRAWRYLLSPALKKWDTRNWLRIRQIECWESHLSIVQPNSVLEISPGSWSSWKRFNNYTAVSFPDFNICSDALSEQFDVVIADQVLEHVEFPSEAISNMRLMTRPGGWVMIATPFLFRVHGRPNDYCRWTSHGLRTLLVAAGFAEDQIWVDSWGNAICARAHTRGQVKAYGFWRPMHNDPEYPMMVWAFARNSPAGTHPLPSDASNHERLNDVDKLNI